MTANTTPASDASKLKPAALIPGVIAALCWIIADVLLVGVVPRPQDFPLFSDTLSTRLNSELIVLVLGASPERLGWGVYLATFSVVLYLLSVPAIRRLLPDTRLAQASCLLVFTGFALSPLGHAGFAYVGLLAHSMLASDGIALEAQVQTMQVFLQLLDVHWLASVTASGLGWLLLLILVASGRSALPRKMAVCTPLPLAILIALICAPFADTVAGRMAGGASLNLALLVFYAGLLTYVKNRKHREPQTQRSAADELIA